MKSYFNKFSLVVAVLTFLGFHQVYAQSNGAILSFKTGVQYGKQLNNLSILVSSDFNGDYSLESIRSAGWQDITKQVKLATDKEFIESGGVDVSKNKVASKPLYIAFKYIGQASARPTQRGWAVSNVTINQNGESKTIAIKDFKIIDSKENHEGATWIKGTELMRFRSNQSVKASESWAIAKIVE